MQALNPNPVSPNPQAVARLMQDRARQNSELSQQASAYREAELLKLEEELAETALRYKFVHRTSTSTANATKSKQHTSTYTANATKSNSTNMSQSIVSTNVNSNTVVSANAASESVPRHITMIIKEGAAVEGGLGPMLSRLPIDLILYIFKFATVLEHADFMPMMHPMLYRQISNYNPITNRRRSTSVVNKAKFDYFLALTLLDKLSVSKVFGRLIQQVVCNSETFSFSPQEFHGFTMLNNRLSPQMPAHGLRQFLHRVQIIVYLEDFYGKVPSHLRRFVPCKASQFNQLTTVDDLWTFCPGARTLRNLTDADTGCNNLTSLDLTIVPSIRFQQSAAVRLWKKADFVVRANGVVVTFKAETNGTYSPFQWTSTYGQQQHSTIVRVLPRGS